MPAAPVLSRFARWRQQRSAAALRFDWSQRQLLRAAVCLPAVAGAIAWGSGRNDPEGGLMAVGGAVAVGFGAILRFGRDRDLPLGVTLLWMAVCTFVGSLSHRWGWPAELAVAIGFGWVFGFVASLGWGAWWVGLQGMVALFAFGSVAADAERAARFGVMVIAGGAVQLIAVLALRASGFVPKPPPGRPTVRKWRPAVAHAFSLRTAPGRHALRTALALSAATAVQLATGLTHGYWVPMTAAILLKPDVHETIARGIARLGGTLIGAGLVTLVVALVRPDHLALYGGLLAAVWLALAVQRVNYGLFAMCITAYVVCTLAALDLPEPELAFYRVMATLLGAAVALAAHAVPLHTRRRRTPAPT